MVRLRGGWGVCEGVGGDCWGDGEAGVSWVRRVVERIVRSVGRDGEYMMMWDVGIVGGL